MSDGELHLQAGLWSRCTVTTPRARHRGGGTVIRCGEACGRGAREHKTSLAVLAMEGEAPVFAAHGAVRDDALYQAALARGLRLKTDLDRLDMSPVGGWRLTVDTAGAITLSWPSQRPLFSAVPLDSPPGWQEAAMDHRAALVLVGYDLGLHGSVTDSVPRSLPRIRLAAETGHLVGGAVLVARSPEEPLPRLFERVEV